MSTKNAKNTNLILTYRDKALKMTRGFLKKWGSHIDEDELISVSDLSLCEAASRFDESRNVSFITFLFYYIKGNLVKAVINSSIINGCDRDTYLERNGEKEYSTSQNKLQEILNNEVAECSMGSSKDTPVDLLLKKELYSISKETCKGLDDVERKIIEKIYLQGEQVVNVAKELGYSRCHISRMKRSALEGLEKAINKKLDYESNDSILRAS